MAEITIKPIELFPYDVNRRYGTYFDFDGNLLDDRLLIGHYSVRYEGKNPAICIWSQKKAKELRNLASYFEGETVEEKRQIVWEKVKNQKLDRQLVYICETFREKPLFLWYVTERYDLPKAVFIKRFMEWYWSNNLKSEEAGVYW